MKRINPISKKKIAIGKLYRAEAREFLLNNPWCAWGLKQNPPQHIRATQIHHQRGRVGRLLREQRFWIPVCQVGHDWIHANIEAARGLGLICQKGQWNNFPK